MAGLDDGGWVESAPKTGSERVQNAIKGPDKEENSHEQIDGMYLVGTRGWLDSKWADVAAPDVFTVALKLPAEPYETKIQISTQEQVQDVRQSIVDQPFGIQYSCFYLQHNGERISDFIALNEIAGLGPDSVFSLVQKPYTEKEARLHVTRVRELVGVAAEKSDASAGLHSGTSLHDAITGATDPSPTSSQVGDVSGYKFNELTSVDSLIPKEYAAPKTLKSIAIAPWTPPPAHLRNKGHLLYLVVQNLQGDQFHITSHVSGFYLNRSSHTKFDPFPRDGSKSVHAHSLLHLLERIDATFEAAFKQLSEYNSKREQSALFSLTNALPVNPWLVPPSTTCLLHHRSDICQTQESFLTAGPDTDNLRDWNEEFQSTRELPVESVQDKVFRERLTSKLFADFNEAALKGAILVARGEIPPLNPTEDRDAQILVYNNVFFSFGADGVGTFATEGGDEAARVATGKDVAGVKLVNQLDIADLFTAGSIIVDYLGKRIVGQSIVPGIFRHREPDENQIDYGGVEGKDVIAQNEAFIKPFEQLSRATFMKKHPVWDKDGNRCDLEASVDTKGLLGTDGRKYVLDLYRLTPLDINWIEQHWSGDEQDEQKNYPHRMAILRPELISAYRMTKLHQYIDSHIESLATNQQNGAPSPAVHSSSDSHVSNGETSKLLNHSDKEDPVNAESSSSLDKSSTTIMNNGQSLPAPVPDRTSASDQSGADEDIKPPHSLKSIAESFEFLLNPDVYSGQTPQTDEDKQEMDKDEVQVRAVCTYMTTQLIPRLIQQLQDGEVGFPIDGESLTSLMHKRGINIRYLGLIAELADEQAPRLQALRTLAIQQMVCRGFKHVACKYMRHLPLVFANAAMSHLLNCFLGGQFNPHPVSELDESMKELYHDEDTAFEQLTVCSLRDEVIQQVQMRYRFRISGDIVEPGKQLQMLREVALKLGLQMLGKDYSFASEPLVEQLDTNDTNETASNDGSKKKKKSSKKEHASLHRSDHKPIIHTFHPDDVVNFVPIVKHAAPKSILAEEAFEGGRHSLAQDQREIGQELLLESLTLHEQIYGILHPEVARMYLSLSNIYYSLDEKSAAAELARKAVVIAERTLGLDSSETILAYLNLALFEHGCGHSALGLKYILHALELTKIVYGPDHPDSITVLNNGAVMLQSLRRYHESRIWFEASVALSDRVSGKASPNTATLLFQLAQALALDKDHRAAVNRMRESCNLFRTLLGPEDRNTKEAETWLDQLTQNAVSVEKRAKQLASGQLKRVHFNAGAPKPMLRPGQNRNEIGVSIPANKNDTTTIRIGDKSVDQRNIDDLLKFINDGGSQVKKTVGKHAPSNRGHNSSSSSSTSSSFGSSKRKLNDTKAKRAAMAPKP